MSQVQRKVERPMHRVGGDAFPVLETQRLLLRAPRLDDVPAVKAIMCEPRVQRYVNCPTNLRRSDVRAILHWASDLFPSGRGCAWIIESKPHARPVGSVRFNRMIRDIGWAEIGYELEPSLWGHGLMTEAVRAVAALGEERFGLSRIEAECLPGNAASQHVLQKSGFARCLGQERHSQLRGQTVRFDVFERRRNEDRTIAALARWGWEGRA